MHIENIINSNINKDDEFIENVLVIWCAKSPYNDFTSVVGWYKNATVYRHYYDNHYCIKQNRRYNILASEKDCTLLPIKLRNKKREWGIPRRGKIISQSYGFGRSNIWFAKQEDAQEWLKN